MKRARPMCEVPEFVKRIPTTAASRLQSNNQPVGMLADSPVMSFKYLDGGISGILVVTRRAVRIPFNVSVDRSAALSAPIQPHRYCLKQAVDCCWALSSTRGLRRRSGHRLAVSQFSFGKPYVPVRKDHELASPAVADTHPRWQSCQQGVDVQRQAHRFNSGSLIGANIPSRNPAITSRKRVGLAI